MVMVVVEDAERRLVLVEPGPRDEWVCRLHARALDRELAAGLPPELGRRRSLWAALLVVPARRRCLATTLQRILEAADDPSTRVARRLHVSTRRRVRACSEELGRLVARLVAPQPVTAAGMARVRLLLTDGAGPLHGPASDAALRRAVQDALDALDAPLTF